MPFGISWSRYLSMWATCIVGGVCGSQMVHMQYKPLEGMEELIEKQVEQLREEMKLRKPTKEEKIEKLLELDRIYIEKFFPPDNSQHDHEKVE